MCRKISIYIEYFMMHSISLSFLSAHAWLVNTKFNIISTYKIFGKNKKKIIYIKYNCIACFISSDLFLARQLSDILCTDESRLFGLGLLHGIFISKIKMNPSWWMWKWWLRWRLINSFYWLVSFSFFSCSLISAALPGFGESNPMSFNVTVSLIGFFVEP